MTPSIDRYNANRPAPSEVPLKREKASGDTAWGTVPEGTEGGGSQTSVAQATLTAVDILDLTSGFVLAASPGAGKAYMVLGVETQALPGTTPFSVPANSRLEVGSLDQVLQDYSSWETTRYDQGADSSCTRTLNGTGSEDMALWVSSQQPARPGIFPAALVENQPLAIVNTGHEFDGGAILAASVADPGSGYAPGDTFVILQNGPNGPVANGEVDTVDGGGGVLTFHITNPGGSGAGYFVGYGNPYVTQKDAGGGDDLLTITVTATDGPGDGELRVAVAYAIIDVT